MSGLTPGQRLAVGKHRLVWVLCACPCPGSSQAGSLPGWRATYHPNQLHFPRRAVSRPCSTPGGRPHCSHPPQDHHVPTMDPREGQAADGADACPAPWQELIPITCPTHAVEQSVAAWSTRSPLCGRVELQENISQGDKGGWWAEGMPVPPRVCAGVAGSSGLCFKASLRLPAAWEKLSPTPARSNDLST